MPKKDKLFLISNMYPSKQFVRYGIFIKKFEVAISDDFIVEKIVLERLPNRSKRLWGYIKLYLRIIKLIGSSGENEMIYVHFPLHVAPAVWILSFFKKNIILNFHGSDVVFDSFLKRMLSKFLNPLVYKSNIVVPSCYYKDKIVNIYNIKPEVVFVYPSGGIDIKLFHPNKLKPTDEFVLGYVSHFDERKGWRLFLNAIEGIIKKENLTNIKILMVGDGPEKNKVKDHLNSLKVKGDIFSNINHKDLAEVYNKLDLFIFPTFMDESLGLVGLEAMSCGVPVIASNVGGPSSYVKNGVNGFIFRNKDIGDLQHKIMTYYALSIESKEIMKINALKTSEDYDSTLVNKSLIVYLKKNLKV